jgi:hypothetical protein
MRKLLTEEIQAIEVRLDQMNVSYLEVYNELLDHYTTALEQVSSDEFASTKGNLDDEFSWSVVRKMEKELLNHVSGQLQRSQLDSLKFWKLDFWKLAMIFAYAGFLFAVSQFVSLDVIILLSFIPALCIMVVLLYQSGNYSLSNELNYHRPRRVIFQAALGKYAVAFNLFYFFYIISSLLLRHQYLGSWAITLTLGYSTIFNLYALSLLNSINLKTFKVIK